MNTVSGIYMITCKITGKSYIGKTIGKIGQRVMYHLNGNTPGCVALHSAIKKYGKENFTWEVLHENVIPELLSMFEMEAIKTYNTLSPNGYNLTAGGETGFQSEETIQKRTETLRSNPPMLGRKHSEESKQQMSISRTGSKRPPETRKKMSDAAMGHPTSIETRQKISKANALPQRNNVHKMFLSLPPEMPLREKTEILSTKFPDVKRKTINYWLSEWDPSKTRSALNENMRKRYFSLSTSLTLIQKRKIIHKEFSGHRHQEVINRWIRVWESDVDYAIPPKEKAYELFLSLPSDMSIKEKRERLYSAFPNLKKPTIAEWVRKWSNYKPYKDGSHHSAEHHQAHVLFLSLPPEMSIVEKRQYLHKNIKGIHRGTISRWVRQWSGVKGRNNPNHPDYERAHKYFFSLPSDMNLNKKTSLFRKEFPHVSKSSVSKWIKKWTGETMPIGSPSHPERPVVHEYFLTLPLNMPISEKRKLILEKFDDTVRRSLVNSWTRQWHIELTGSPPPIEKWYREPYNHWKKGKPAHNRRPEYDDAQELFLSLSPMVPSREKSKQLLVKYPHIPKGTIYQWTSRWQSELTIKGEQK